jgi:hypothetical protein
MRHEKVNLKAHEVALWLEWGHRFGAKIQISKDQSLDKALSGMASTVQ